MRSILINVVSVIGGELSVRAANFVAVLFIARAYGRMTLGAYAISLAVVTVVVMFADNGLQTTAITQISSATAGRNETIGELTLSKTVLLVAAAIVLTTVAALTRQGPVPVAIGIWVTARAILQSYSQLQMAVLKAVSKASWIGIIQAVHSCILLVGIWACFKQGWNLFVLLRWLTTCQLLELLLCTVVLYRSGHWPRWPARLNLSATMKMAAPFGIAYGLANLIVRSDTIVLSEFSSLSEVGAFSAANSILLIVYVSAWLFGSILLPEMVRLSRRPESLKSFATHWLRWVVLLTVPCSLLVSVLAPRGISVLYGPTFAASGHLASVMAMACPFILLNSIYTALTVATNSPGIFLGIYGTGAIAAFALDFFLGGVFGPVGIAAAIVIREVGMLAGFWLLMSRRLSPTTQMGYPIAS